MAPRPVRAAAAASIVLLLLTATTGWERRSGGPRQGNGRGQAGRPHRRSRQSGRNAIRPHDAPARAPAPGPGAIPRREAPGRLRQDARAHHPQRPHRPGRAGSLPPGRRAGGTASRGRLADDPRPRRGRPVELHGPHLCPRRPPDLYEQRRRQHQSLHGRPGRTRRAVPHDPGPVGRRAAPGRGDPGRVGDHARRPKALRLRQPVQPPPRDRYPDRRGRADVRCRRRALRCRPRRRQGLRQQLGRPPAAIRRSRRPGRSRRRGQGRPGPAYRQRGLHQRHRPRFGRGQGRDPRPSPRFGPGPVARRPLGRLRQRRLGQSQRHRHRDGHGRRNDLAQGLSGRPFRGLAQRLGLFGKRQDALRRQRHPERHRRHNFQSGKKEIQAEGAHPRRLVPQRSRPECPAGDRVRRQRQRPCLREDSLQADRRLGIQFPPVRRFGHELHRAATERPLGPYGRRLRKLPQRADQSSIPQAPTPSAAPARPRADRRAERLQACRLHHQGEPDLRPGPRRRRRGERRSVPVRLRRERDAQPAQARPRVRAPRQHLLQRHPQRRRPSVVDDGLRDRLSRTVFRRLAAELSRRHGPGRDRRPGLRAERIHLGQRPQAWRLDLELRRVHDADLRLDGPRTQRQPSVG